MGRGGKIIYKRAVVRKRKKDEDDDDDEYVAEEEEESSDNFDSFNEESIDGSEASNSGRSAASEEEISSAKPKSRRGNSSSQRRSRVSDYEELEEDDDSKDDEDFSPDDNDEEEDWEEDSLISGNNFGSTRRGALKREGRKRKRKVSKTKVKRRSRKVVDAPERRKRRSAAPSSDDDDGDFVVKDRALISARKKGTKKVRRRTAKSRSARKKRSLTDPVSFDSDNLTSDDDLSVKFAVDRPKNKKIINPGRRKKTEKVDSETSDSDFEISKEGFMNNDCGVVARQCKSKNAMTMNETSRKQVSVESECTDSDNELPENEMKDLKVERALNLQKVERGSVGNKGKKKEADDLGKQLCGICLSEEQKGTIQGILNCCSHYFCFACIMEWSKVESRCPVCKRRFFSITKSSKSDQGLEIRSSIIRVQMRDQVYQPSEEELRVLLDPYENVVCIECHQGGDDSLMLLCDICDSSAHTYCVGLGREVPEGNWYCECCKHAGEGSLHSRVLDTQAASSSHMSHGSVEENGLRNLQSNTSFHRSISFQGQSSSQGFDLNVSPRNFMEENGIVSSQASGAGASTLSGRRAIQQRIRFLLSNNRARQLHAGPNRTDSAFHNEAVHSAWEQNGESLHNSESLNSMCRVLTTEQPQESSRNFLHTNLVPCTSSEGRNFRHVEGATKQVHSIVKHYLKKLPQEIPLEGSAFKKMTKKVTHTILAACGIQHCRNMVSSVLQPPDICSHDLDCGPVNLLRGCCTSCFTDYVKNVVKMFVETL